MKLPNGYGSVVKLKGRRRKPYAARITVSWTKEGKKIKKYLGYFKTRQEAMKALADYSTNPYDLDNHKLTFADVYEKWAKYKYKGERVNPVYIAAYKNLSNLHEMLFIDIRKRHIQAEIDNCTKSVQTKKHMKSLCNQIFKYAIDQEIVATNFASLVEMPKSEQSKIHKPFTPEELEYLFEQSDDFGARVALILCYTGLRPTELLQIKIANVKLEQRYMTGGIKTAAGKDRIIPIAEKILPFITEMYDATNEYLLIDPLDDKPVLNYNRLIQHIWRKSLILNGLTEKHLPHDGRHTCATLMDDAEIPLKIRQLILGHSAKDIIQIRHEENFIVYLKNFKIY